MKQLRTPALIAAAIAATAAISSAAGASAAVHYAILGAKNATTAPTYINNSAGIPLALNSKAGTAPLAVGSSTLVGKLNADEVDGFHASSFAKVTGKTGVITAFNGPAVCPAGTVLTGGGGFGNAPLDYNGPDPIFDANDNIVGYHANAWWAAVVSGDAYSYAICYSPTGAAIPGAGTVPSAANARTSWGTLTRSGREALANTRTPSSPPVSPSPAAPQPTPSPAG